MSRVGGGEPAEMMVYRGRRRPVSPVARGIVPASSTRREGSVATAPIILAFLFAFAMLLLEPTALAPTVDPGVTFQPSGSWANISFASRQTFSNSIVVDATGVTFDGVRYGVEKSPRSLPRVEIVIDIWAPLQQVVNQTSVSFTGDAPTGSTVVFNLTNVLRNREYIFKVDGSERDRATTGSTGHASFQWSTWSLHSFEIVLGRSMGGPPPVGNVTAAFDYTVNAWSVTFFDRSTTEGNTTITSRVWTFGDGASSTDAQPVHDYPAPWLWSTYHPSLAVCNDAGDCDATSKEITFVNWFVILVLAVTGIVLVFLLWLRRRRRKDEEEERAQEPSEPLDTEDSEEEPTAGEDAENDLEEDPETVAQGRSPPMLVLRPSEAEVS